MKKKIIKLTIYIFAFISMIVSFISILIDSITFLKCLSSIITITEILVIIYCKYLWKYKYLNFFKIKNLNGEYECTINTNYPNIHNEIKTKIIINQDLFDIQVNMTSKETKSYSIISDIEKNHSREYLLYTYKTETNAEYREHNRDQFGSVRLYIDDLDNLEGEYWTNNNTQGLIKLIKIKSK